LGLVARSRRDCNRAARPVEAIVPPNGTATFRFECGKSSTPPDGEFFQLVVEGECWLPNTEFRLD
jgi:hypothetical protein